MPLIIQPARFSVRPFDAGEMESIIDPVLESISARIKRGYNVNDSPAKPLKAARRGRAGYPEQKMRRGLRPIRDWTFTGETLRAMTITASAENDSTIGFDDPKADLIAHLNNLLDVQFGVAPSDRAVFEQSAQRAAIERHLVVSKQVQREIVRDVIKETVIELA